MGLKLRRERESKGGEEGVAAGGMTRTLLQMVYEARRAIAHSDEQDEVKRRKATFVRPLRFRFEQST